MTQWEASWCRCRMCGHLQVSVIPVPLAPGISDDSLECDNCGHMTSECLHTTEKPREEGRHV